MRDSRACRRRFLRLVGVAGVGSLAGCPVGSEDDGVVTPIEVPTDRTGQPPSRTGHTEAAMFTAEDGDSADEFGESVAVSGDGTVALVGAPADEDPNGELAGSAYVFEHSDGSWTQRAKLAPSDGETFDSFGRAVAVSSDGTTALVGARADTNQGGNRAGAAYVFGTGGGSWTQSATLVARDGDGDDGFGGSVALSSDGRSALVGAHGDEDPNGSLAGSAYVFEADGAWGQRAKLTAADGDSFDNVGESVTISGDGTTALVGAPADEDPHGRLAGSAYVFTATDGSWTQQAKLTPDDGDRLDRFGWSVAVSGDGTTALVGAYGEAGSDGDESGAVYAFEVTDGAWTQQAKLTASDGAGGDFFGFATTVTADGTVAVVGAPGDEISTGAMAGAAYVFEHSDGSWSQRQTLVASDGRPEDLLGRGVGVDDGGTTALVGAPFDTNRNGESAGSAYVFTR